MMIERVPEENAYTENMLAITHEIELTVKCIEIIQKSISLN